MYGVTGLKLHIDGASITAEGCVCDATGDNVQKRGEHQACTVAYTGDSIAEAKLAAEAALKAAAGV
jgi:hypothetical protein